MLGVSRSRAQVSRRAGPRRGRWSTKSLSDGFFFFYQRCQPERKSGNRDLFILLFLVYLIVSLTCSEWMSDAGLRSAVFKSLQNGCVYFFALNTCTSEMGLIKFDERKKKKKRGEK